MSFRVGLKKGTPCVAFLFLLTKFLFQGNLGSENGKKQQSQLNSTDDRAYCSDFRCCFPDFKEHLDNRSWQQKQAAQKPCFPEYAVRITPCQTVSHRPARTVSEYFIRFFRWSFQKPISETYHCNRKNQINQHHINPKSHLKAPSFPILSISIIAYYHYLVKPYPTNRARSRTLQQVRTSQNDKNFPQEYPPKTKRIKSLLCKGGCSWGKFSGGQGGLEGRNPSPKEGFLRLQGLPSLQLINSSPTEKKDSTRRRRRG